MLEVFNYEFEHEIKLNLSYDLLFSMTHELALKLGGKNRPKRFNLCSFYIKNPTGAEFKDKFLVESLYNLISYIETIKLAQSNFLQQSRTLVGINLNLVFAMTLVQLYILLSSFGNRKNCLLSLKNL